MLTYKIFRDRAPVRWLKSLFSQHCTSVFFIWIKTLCKKVALTDKFDLNNAQVMDHVEVCFFCVSTIILVSFERNIICLGENGHLIF